MPGEAIAIGAFRFTPRTGELRHGLEEVKLAPRAAAVLTFLAERAQQVVTKDELLAYAWKGRIVGDEAVTSCIQELRQALGDDARQPRFIETWHRRGYKLIVPAAGTETEASATGDPVSSSLSDKPSIAILPFQNMSGDNGQEYFADGITEDVTTALSCYHELAVIACNSAFTFKGQGADVREVARHLGARYVLKGSARTGGGRVRISVQLIAAPSGEHLWAEHYDRELNDILSLQDEISRQIVATMAPEIRRAEERRADRLPARGLKAHDLAMQAHALIRETENCSTYEVPTAAVERAAALAERAVAADPMCVSAYAALARAHVILPEPLYFQPGAATILDKAIAAAEVLRRLDSSNHTAYLVLGQVCLRRRQASEALAHLRWAHDLNPNDCNVLRWLAWAEFNLGLATESSQHYKQALRLSPRDSWRHLSYWGLAWAAFIGGAPREGVAWARKSLADQPAYFPARTIMAACLVECDDGESAREQMAYLVAHRPEYIRSRLAGNNYLGVPELSHRFTEALRKAAGPLLGEPGQPVRARHRRA